MKQEQVSATLQDYAEAEIPAHTVDLTVAVREQFLRVRVGQGRRKLMTVAATVLLIAGVFLFAVPSTLADNAWEALLQRLGLALGDENEMRNSSVSMLAPTYAAVTPTPVSEEALQQQAPFVLPQPGWLPDGLAYDTGSVHQRNDGTVEVNRWYRPSSDPSGPDTPYLSLEVATGDLSAYFLSEQAAQSVLVVGLPAVYIHGSWTTEEPIEPGETTRGLIWDNAADSAYLSWADAELSYRIQAHGLGLVLEDLIRIAESLQ